MIKIKIKSKTDVITNSSTEVFIYYSGSLKKKIEEFVDEFLGILGSNKRCKDLFKVSFNYSDYVYDQYYELYCENKIDNERYPKEPKESDIENALNEYEDLPGSNGYDYEYPMYDGITIEALDPKFEEIAKKLEYLVNDNCTHEAFYD